MQLEIYDSAQTPQEIALSPKFKPVWTGAQFNKRARKNYQQHGGFLLGDGTAKMSQITLKYPNTGMTDQQFMADAQPVLKFLENGNGPHYLRMIPDAGAIPPLRWLISTKAFKNKGKEGAELRYHEREITLHAIDHFPEDDTETDSGSQVLGDGDSFAIGNDGDLEAKPIIEITALTNIANFTLENESAELHFTVDDFSFTTGKKYVFDFIDNRILLFSVGGGSFVPRSQTITDGGPWGIVRGSNTIKYTSSSGQCDVRVRFRAPRILF